MATNGYVQNGRSVTEVLREFKEETKEFVVTRVQMLRSEMIQKMGGWKAGVPALMIGLGFLVMTFVLLTGLLVAVIGLAFNSTGWGYALSFAIVMVIYGATGAVLALYGVKKIREAGVVPERTIKVLRQDGVWIQSEARSQV
jgi:VIT1/CCC1 family predicted Fe2+/Mn2+ transporter